MFGTHRQHLSSSIKHKAIGESVNNGRGTTDVVTLSPIYHLFYFGRSACLPFTVSAKNTITGCLRKWTRLALGPGSDFRVFIVVVSTNSNIRYIVLAVEYYIAYFTITCIEISTLLSIMVCKLFSDKTNTRIGSLNFFYNFNCDFSLHDSCFVC